MIKNIKLRNINLNKTFT